MRSYRIYDVEFNLDYPFVDRVAEVGRILGFNERRVIAKGMINVVYGPKGCGKTTFFQVLAEALDQTSDQNMDIVIVGSEREAWRVERLYAPRTLTRLLRDVSELLSFTINSQWGLRGYVDVVKLVKSILDYLVYRLDEGRDVFIVLDEVKADSEERLSEFRGWLEGFSNTLSYDASRYAREKGGSITVIALTSDALVEGIRYVVGSKVNWVLLWNLPYDGMVELAKHLHLDLDPRLLWRLTGGNPRALRLIKRWGVEGWLEREVIGNLKSIMREARELYHDSLWDEVERVVEDLNSAKWSLIRLLVRNNVLIYTSGSDHLSDIPREEWVGRDYAYQLPVYQRVLELMSRMRNLEVTGRDLLAIL